MWVFGYGSLMWDGWEAQFLGTRHERPGFDLLELEVALSSREVVPAVVAVNQRHAPTYFSGCSAAELVVKLRATEGTSGRCQDYLAGLRSKLTEYGVRDDQVEALWRML